VVDQAIPVLTVTAGSAGLCRAVYSVAPEQINDCFTAELKIGGRRTKPTTVKGRTFESFIEACDFFGISGNTVRVHLRQTPNPTQQQFDLAFSKKRLPNNNGHTITVEGVTYNSFLDACGAYGHHRNTVRLRLNKFENPTPEQVDRCFTEKPKRARLKENT